MNFKLIKDNTEEHAPVNPLTTYELIVDMGENGTKTIFSSDSFAELYVAIDEMKTGDYSRVDFTEEEMKETKGFSVNLVLTASELEIIKYDGETSATAELQAYKVVRDEVVTGLCPRSWDNTDVSPLSRVQINGILDNCEKCQRYSQCNKVAELNDRLVELDNKESEK